MHVEAAKPPAAMRFDRSYPGREDQVREVRADLARIVDGCPLADDFVLLASELCANAVIHTRSGLPGGVFTVKVEIRPGEYAQLEVEDQGGPWIEQDPDDEHGRGLALVAYLVGEDNWTIEDGSKPGARVVRARLDWAAQS
jgi:serine/threonine-protein kinase RsbW